MYSTRSAFFLFLVDLKFGQITKIVEYFFVLLVENLAIKDIRKNTLIVAIHIKRKRVMVNRMINGLLQTTWRLPGKSKSIQI